MSGVAALLTELEAAGVRLVPSDSNCLTVDAPRGVVTSEIRDVLRQHKFEIITLLQTEAKTKQVSENIELLYIFGERAAIMEIDSGMLREEAEWLAAREIFDTSEKLRAYAEHHPVTRSLLQRGGEIVDVRFVELGQKS